MAEVNMEVVRAVVSDLYPKYKNLTVREFMFKLIARPEVNGFKFLIKEATVRDMMVALNMGIDITAQDKVAQPKLIKATFDELLSKALDILKVNQGYGLSELIMGLRGAGYSVTANVADKLYIKALDELTRAVAVVQPIAKKETKATVGAKHSVEKKITTPTNNDGDEAPQRIDDPPPSIISPTQKEIADAITAYVTEVNSLREWAVKARARNLYLEGKYDEMLHNNTKDVTKRVVLESNIGHSEASLNGKSSY